MINRRSIFNNWRRVSETRKIHWRWPNLVWRLEPTVPIWSCAAIHLTTVLWRKLARFKSLWYVFLKIAKNCPKGPKLAKMAERCQKYQTLSKTVLIFWNFLQNILAQNSQKWPKIVKFSLNQPKNTSFCQIVKFPDTSKFYFFRTCWIVNWMRQNIHIKTCWWTSLDLNTIWRSNPTLCSLIGRNACRPEKVFR